MAASPLLGLNIQAPGSNVNTWGDILNTQVFPLLEQKSAGVATVTLNGNYSLTNGNFVSTETKQAVLIFAAGTLSIDPTVTVPSTQNVWLVVNNTGRPVAFSNGGGSSVTLPVGRRGWLFSTGTGLVLFDAVADAATQANAAAASALAAANSVTAAAASAGAAAGSAGTAATSAGQAMGFRNSAQSIYLAFDARSLGAYASDPTTDNQGNALIIGASYFNTTANEGRVWNGAAWQVFVPTAANYYNKSQVDALMVSDQSYTLALIHTATLT